MKHKRLYNILCKVEDIITIILFSIGYIILISVPTSGEYTAYFILLKFGAMIGLVILAKIEGLFDDWYNMYNINYYLCNFNCSNYSWLKYKRGKRRWQLKSIGI